MHIIMDLRPRTNFLHQFFIVQFPLISVCLQQLCYWFILFHDVIWMEWTVPQAFGNWTAVSDWRTPYISLKDIQIPGSNLFLWVCFLPRSNARWMIMEINHYIWLRFIHCWRHNFHRCSLVQILIELNGLSPQYHKVKQLKEIK